MSKKPQKPSTADDAKIVPLYPASEIAANPLLPPWPPVECGTRANLIVKLYRFPPPTDPTALRSWMIIAQSLKTSQIIEEGMAVRRDDAIRMAAQMLCSPSLANANPQPRPEGGERISEPAVAAEINRLCLIVPED